jgi:hypothetical protein
MHVPLEGRLSPPSRRVLAAAIVAVGLFATVVAGFLARLELRVACSEALPSAGSFVLPAPDAARLIASRYTEVVADIVWTRMLVYYGAQTGMSRDPKYMSAYAEAVTSLDPYFRAPYAWAGYAIPLATNNWISPDNVESGIRFLRAGVARFPDDADLHGMLGYNLFYELPRWINDDARIVRARIEGAEHLRAEAALGGGAPWMALAATRAMEEVNLNDLAARHLEESAYATDDPELRQRILNRLAQFRADADVKGIARAANTLDHYWRERTPFLTDGMLLLLSSPEAQARMAEGLVPPRFLLP